MCVSGMKTQVGAMTQTQVAVMTETISHWKHTSALRRRSSSRLRLMASLFEAAATGCSVGLMTGGACILMSSRGSWGAAWKGSCWWRWCTTRFRASFSSRSLHPHNAPLSKLVHSSATLFSPSLHPHNAPLSKLIHQQWSSLPLYIHTMPLLANSFISHAPLSLSTPTQCPSKQTHSSAMLLSPSLHPLNAPLSKLTHQPCSSLPLYTHTMPL